MPFQNLNSVAWITILIVVSLIFNGLVYSSLQLTIIDQRSQSNQTSQIRNTQIRDIQEQQNRTQQLLPIFFKQFNQTDLLVNLTNQVLGSGNETQNLVRFLTENFGENSDYLARENFQYNQANESHALLQEIRDMLNNSRSSRLVP